MSKDQAIGGAILVVCVAVAIIYTLAIFVPSWLYCPLGININDQDFRMWAVAIPVFLAFVAIMLIGAWIGWTMATTPPPKPIEEITTEMEEKKEEPSMDSAESEPSTNTTSEKKKKNQ
jgi:predicted DNA-binding transcriptional regulator